MRRDQKSVRKLRTRYSAVVESLVFQIALCPRPNQVPGCHRHYR